MTKRIYKCLKCGRYTLKQDRCPVCGGLARVAHPPRFSPVDKYGEYRREMRRMIEKLEGEK